MRSRSVAEPRQARSDANPCERGNSTRWVFGMQDLTDSSGSTGMTVKSLRIVQPLSVPVAWLRRAGPRREADLSVALTSAKQIPGQVSQSRHGRPTGRGDLAGPISGSVRTLTAVPDTRHGRYDETRKGERSLDLITALALNGSPADEPDRVPLCTGFASWAWATRSGFRGTSSSRCMRFRSRWGCPRWSAATSRGSGSRQTPMRG